MFKTWIGNYYSVREFYLCLALPLFRHALSLRRIELVSWWQVRKLSSV